METSFKIKIIVLSLLIFIALTGFVALLFLINNFSFRHAKEMPVSREVAVTIPEGLNVRQIGGLLEKNGLFSKEDFIMAARNEEGYLFPDTYRFYKDAKPQDIIAKMRRNFDKKVTAGKDIIIMASILEEEVKSTEDRKIVAGILWKRIDRGMGLNVDAALTYVLGKTSAELTVGDLKYNSPYNTYLYRGLPPAPISNPGLDTITAALNPTASKYFYYLTDKEGSVHYAVTLEEHTLNKFKYLR